MSRLFDGGYPIATPAKELEEAIRTDEVERTDAHEDRFRCLSRIVEQGTAVLLAEPNASKALQICHRAYVLKVGAVVLSGPAAELRENEEVKEADLGG